MRLFRLFLAISCYYDFFFYFSDYILLLFGYFLSTWTILAILATLATLAILTILAVLTILTVLTVLIFFLI